MPHHVAIANSATTTIGRRYCRGWTADSRGGVLMLVASRSHTALDDHRDRLAATEAERREPVAGPALGERREERGQDARAARTDRMSEGDRAAADVDGGRI